MTAVTIASRFEVRFAENDTAAQVQQLSGETCLGFFQEMRSEATASPPSFYRKYHVPGLRYARSLLALIEGSLLRQFFFIASLAGFQCLR
jgi:hypothetical protein